MENRLETPLKKKQQSYNMIQQFHSKHISGENQNLKICMFIAALFTIARTWKQSKCPSNEEWIKNM